MPDKFIYLVYHFFLPLGLSSHLLATHRQSIEDFILSPDGSGNYFQKPVGWELHIDGAFPSLASVNDDNYGNNNYDNNGNNSNNNNGINNNNNDNNNNNNNSSNDNNNNDNDDNTYFIVTNSVIIYIITNLNDFWKLFIILFYQKFDFEFAFIPIV